MKPVVVPLVLGLALLAGCVSGPAVSKASEGNLEVNISGPNDSDVKLARLYVDEIFIGNISQRLPVLHLKNGKRTIRVELEGFKSWQQTLQILGEPNHQVLNVVLEKR